MLELNACYSDVANISLRIHYIVFCMMLPILATRSRLPSTSAATTMATPDIWPDGASIAKDGGCSDGDESSVRSLIHP